MIETDWDSEQSFETYQMNNAKAFENAKTAIVAAGGQVYEGLSAEDVGQLKIIDEVVFPQYQKVDSVSE